MSNPTNITHTDSQRENQRNFFLGLPFTVVCGTEVANITSSGTQCSFRPTYLVIPKSIAPDFEILDIKIGKLSQFISTDPLPAETFSGEIVILRDKIANVIIDFPLPMMMDDCHIGDVVCLTVRNRNPANRYFHAVLVGPPIP